MNSKEKIILEVFNGLFKSHYQQLDFDRESLPEWDSMRHAELILAIQKKLGIRFSSQDIIQINSARELLDAVNRAS